MKYILKYSPDASEKLREIKQYLSASFGKEVATKLLSKIMKDIRALQDNPELGASVEAMLNIPTDYRFLHVEHNYAFYRIENNVVYVTDIFNEREAFVRKMFGESLRTHESIEFWGE